MRRRFPLGFGPHLWLSLLLPAGCFDEPSPVGDGGADSPSSSTAAGTSTGTTIGTSPLTTGVSLTSGSEDGGTGGESTDGVSTSTTRESSTSGLVPASTTSDSLAIDTLDASTSGNGESTQGSPMESTGSTGSPTESTGSTSSTGSTLEDSSSSSGSSEESTGGDPAPGYCETSGANAIFCEDFDHDGWRDQWTLLGTAAAFHQVDGLSPPTALGISTEGISSEVRTVAISRPAEPALESGFTFRTAVHVADFCPTDRPSARTLISITTASSLGPSRTGSRLMLRMRARTLQLVFIPSLTLGVEDVTDLRAELGNAVWTHVALVVSPSAVQVFIDDVLVPPGEIPLADTGSASSQRVFAVGQIDFADSGTSSCAIAFDDVAVLPPRR